MRGKGTFIVPVRVSGRDLLVGRGRKREEYKLRIFQNSVLRKIFGPKREEDGSWRKLHNNELYSLYFSPTIVRVIKARRMRWVGQVICLGE
jgi:hypothetical protein